MCDGVTCTDPNVNDRVVEPVGDDKYNVLDGDLVRIRSDIAGLTRARDIARSGTGPEGRLLWFNKADDRIEFYNHRSVKVAE